MTPTASSRPRRSRAGFFFLLVVGVLAAWELVGRVSASTMWTPLKFASAACSMVKRGAPPSEELLAKNAYRPLPYVNYGLKPNWTRVSTNPNAPKKTSNSFGFRGAEPAMPKPTGRYRIVCLGGSTTYDDGVSDDETYPVRLEQALRAGRPGRDLDVVNAGVPSYTTAENLCNLALRVLDLQPDAIVLYEGINDFRTRQYRNFDNAYFHYRKVWDGSLAGFERGSGDLSGDFNINQLIQLPLLPDNGEKVDNIKHSGTTAFRRNLESLAGIAKTHGLAVVLVSNIVDANRSDVDPDLVAGMAETNAVVADVAKEQGALFVDLAAKFPKGDQVPPGGLFVDLVHNNARGSALKAQIIADAMLKDLLK